MPVFPDLALMIFGLWVLWAWIVGILPALAVLRFASTRPGLRRGSVAALDWIEDATLACFWPVVGLLVLMDRDFLRRD